MRSLSLNHLNSVSLEWALTHRSFPGILPDSSYFPGATLKFILKFDVRMIYHQSHAFLQDLSHSFHHWLNLFAFGSSGVAQQFLVVFRIVILNIWRPKKIFPLNLALFSSRFMALASCHPLIIGFDCENPFHPSREIQRSFQFDSLQAIFSDLSILSFQLSFSKSYRCIIQVFSNQLGVSSFTCI